MKVPSKLRRQVQELNRIIHTRNLYRKNARFVFAQASGDGITVEHLTTGARVPYVDGEFTDAYNQPVKIT